MNILFAVSEAAPFVKTGGLADVAGALPKALAAQGHDVRVVLPLYEAIGEDVRHRMQFLKYTYVFLAWRRQYCGIFQLKQDGVTYYFLDNEYYFKRANLYSHYDDGERFGFFSRAVVQILPLLNWTPDVIHCNDWQTALVPIYLREEHGEPYDSIRTVFTIHNVEYQGKYARSTLTDLFGLPDSLYTDGRLAFDDQINLMKGAIYTADYITTVSPTYAGQLTDPAYAHGLHDVIRENSHKIQGILNGLDMEAYDPSTDGRIYQRYSAEDPAGKVYNKLELQRLLNLRSDESIPLVACVSRLAAHKGFDIVLEALPGIMDSGVQFVILGTGEWEYEQRFLAAQSQYPGRLSANIMYSDALSRQIYAGADIFLMPSRSEPCGLAQMIAMRYGTLPLVRETGGLKDTVFNPPAENANGFSFQNYSAWDLLDCLHGALGLFQKKSDWHAIMQRGMSADFGWTQSAGEYAAIYSRITNK